MANTPTFQSGVHRTTVSIGDSPFLAGEDPLTQNPRDARAWMTVYEQLIDVNQRSMPQAPDPERSLIEARLATYGERLAFWQQRHFALAGLVVDDETRTLGYRGTTTRLTQREYSLFMTLASMSGQYLTARQLVQRSWGDRGLSNEELRIYVSTLRRKLSSLAAGDILNRRGLGYTLQLVSEAAGLSALHDGDGACDRQQLPDETNGAHDSMDSVLVRAPFPRRRDTR